MLSQINWAAGGASVQAKQLFGPYGNVRYHPGTFNTAKGFTGQYNDQLTGLDYFNARYYDPVAGVFLSPDSVQGNVSGMNPYGYVGGNPETATDPSGQAFINDQEIESLAEGAAYVEVPQVYQDAFSDGPTLDPTVAPTVSATAGDTTYTYDPTSDVILINKPGQLVPQGYTVYAGSAYSQAISQLNQLLASMGGTAIDSAVLAKHGISDLLPKEGGPQTQAGTSGLGGKPPISPPTAASPQPCSFTPDTPVTTKQGKEPIGKLQVGEEVLAYNPKTHKMEYEPVVHVWTHTDTDLVDLTLTTTTPARHGKPATHTSEVLHTTSEHPFFIKEHGFVAAGQLKLGMQVLRADGHVGVITGWKLVPGKQLMYNLEVAQDHTFTVGDGQWVVHNKCDRQELRNNLARTGTLLEGQQAHHIIPCQLESHPLVQKAGFDINSAENGIGLPTTPEMSEADSLPQHLGRHPVYTSRVGRLLDNAYDDLAEEYGNFNNVTVAAAQDALTGIIGSVKNAIMGAGGGCTINDVPLE